MLGGSDRNAQLTHFNVQWMRFIFLVHRTWCLMCVCLYVNVCLVMCERLFTNTAKQLWMEHLRPAKFGNVGRSRAFSKWDHVELELLLLLLPIPIWVCECNKYLTGIWFWTDIRRASNRGVPMGCRLPAWQNGRTNACSIVVQHGQNTGKQSGNSVNLAHCWWIINRIMTIKSVAMYWGFF